MRRDSVVVLWLGWSLGACSADHLIAQRETAAGVAGAGFGNAGGLAPAGSIDNSTGAAGSGSAVSNTDAALHVHVENEKHREIEVATLACTAKCVEVNAVATSLSMPALGGYLILDNFAATGACN